MVAETGRTQTLGQLGLSAKAGRDVAITGLAVDSREVRDGYLFAAMPGTRVHGAEFITYALRQGASAILTDAEGARIAAEELEASDAALVIAEDPRQALAYTSALWFGAQPGTMVAVTGTNGKTSVATFVRQIWMELGHEAVNLGTTGVEGAWSAPLAHTTPEPITLHRTLAAAAQNGITHAAMEASSHGLVQRRLDGVALSVAGFTNLGRDHLDYHTDMDDYFRAKMRLFDTLLPKGDPAVIFADDAWSERAVSAAELAGAQVLSVGRKGGFLQLKRVEHLRHKQIGEVHHDGRIFEVHLPLAGDFQFANALVAAGMAMASGVSADVALEALETLKGASGRLDLVGSTADGAPCYVDYAHKPEALENVLEAVRPFTTGRVVVVFGCGGDRDRGKRPIMGSIATKLADVVIVTDDNPRSEEPEAIRAEIMLAAPGAQEIGDRAEAIRTAVGMLQAGDTLIVAGKGHEEGQTVGDKVLPFSDHAEIRKALAETAA